MKNSKLIRTYKRNRFNCKQIKTQRERNRKLYEFLVKLISRNLRKDLSHKQFSITIYGILCLMQD